MTATKDLPVIASKLNGLAIDHIAIAVSNLSKAVAWYTEKLGFSLIEQRTTVGKKTGMVSAVLEAGQISVVLMEGTDEHSQISRYVEAFGQGVQHVAFRVDDVDAVVEDLRRKGVTFDTDVIEGSGLKQAFTSRDPHSGMMMEFIERLSDQDGGFATQNVDSLFQQLEEKNAI